MATRLKKNKILCVLWMLASVVVTAIAVVCYAEGSRDGYLKRYPEYEGNMSKDKSGEVQTTAVYYPFGIDLLEDREETESNSETGNMSGADQMNETNVSQENFNKDTYKAYSGYTMKIAGWLLLGVVLCVIGGFVFQGFCPKIDCEWFCLIFLLGAFQFVGDSLCVIAAVRLHQLPGGQWMLYGIAVSVSCMIVLGLMCMIWMLRRQGSEASYCGRWIRGKLQEKSIRWQFFYLILIAFLATGIIYWAAERMYRNYFLGAVYEVQFYRSMMMMAPCIFAALLLVLVMRKRSVAGDMEQLVKESIKNSIAQEKLKIELITNISHDLKTPLTSIIGYGEQLQAMNLPEEASCVIGKLNHKSEYLQDMVEEVFELSKAASGHLQMKKERIDLGRLLEQTLGEMDDKLREAGFNWKKSFPQTGMIVCCDGMHMHRVFQNLFDNVIKYTCKGTRIFVKAIQNGADSWEVRIKNTASYEMNFNPEEITNRFVRGEKARTGEGSGLGLAIAKTYTESCGGSFSIEVEDDVFTAVVTLPGWKEL